MLISALAKHGYQNRECADNVCMRDCFCSVKPKTSYISSVITGMVVRAAVHQKERKSWKIAQFLLVPVGNSIR